MEDLQREDFNRDVQDARDLDEDFKRETNSFDEKTPLGFDKTIMEEVSEIERLNNEMTKAMNGENHLDKIKYPDSFTSEDEESLGELIR